jgi:hypothetical protein
VQREIEEQNLYEQWKRERGVTPAAVTTSSDVTSAQRLLTALGYYRGPIDGVYGPGTRSAVMQSSPRRACHERGRSLRPSFSR